MCVGGARLAWRRTFNLIFWDRKGFVPGGQVGPGKALRRAQGDLERLRKDRLSDVIYPRRANRPH